MKPGVSPTPPDADALAGLHQLSLRQMLSGNVVAAAAGLLGCVMIRTLPDGREIHALLVETEAYHMAEPGSHAYRGKTPRNAVMFGPPGRLYVYFTYGMWHCCNIVCEPEGVAAAVLLRAAVSVAKPELRLSGPGLLCRGLELTREHNGIDTLSTDSPLRLLRPQGWTLPGIEWTTRVGFSFEDTYQWRATWAGHAGLSPGKPGIVIRRQKGRR